MDPSYDGDTGERSLGPYPAKCSQIKKRNRTEVIKYGFKVRQT